jgi:hypothetical protein
VTSSSGVSTTTTSSSDSSIDQTEILTNDTKFMSSFELFSEGKIANSFDKISMGINIMPS